MKKLLIIFLLAFVSIGYAQQYSDHYYKRKEVFENTLDTENEIIFLGNSITEGGDWKVLFPDINAVNRGISGDVTDGILFRLNEVTSSRPDKVFLLIGTNDLARGKSMEDVVNNIEKIIEQIKEQSPNTKIYLQSIMPVNPDVGDKFSGHKSNHQKIIDTNKRLKMLAKAQRISYINLHKPMRNAKKYLKPEYTYDGLHLSKEGYQKWKSILDKYVN
ncbi:SGNH/GDSL hydrolase family protein [Gelidibacter maritimus]|uniref:Sialate O-acetylesterase n=1 Tax=Gelidibacter maritimus TaxID=2761487 RepID=A0A7W2M5X6_9FLAO|nr:SGNH/GDSL hydrolase family protein [Gelidibacter maritimus]MBA6153242.1 sialate O-acetylesterase [Gelidibacter maritimus]